jgi:hypothetical protein
MPKLFIDSNFLFDLTERDTRKRELIKGSLVFVSPLSYHILFYTYKYKVPENLVIEHKKQFHIVDLTDNILSKSLEGPTDDLEDNIQLHSAIVAEANYFLTSDKKLLRLKYFGKTKIVDILSN